MHYPDPIRIEGYEGFEEALEGPLAPPGTYQVQLNVGEQTYTAVFQIHKDPHIAATQQDLQTQFELLLAIRDKISEVHSTINAIRDIRRQVEGWEHSSKGNDAHETVTTIGKQLKEKLAALEEELFQVKAKNQLDTMDFPIKLSAKLIVLSGVVASADAAPTQQAQQVFEELSARVNERLQQLRKLIAADVAVFNKLIRDANLPAIIPAT
jgi:hypothetical protein